MPRYILDSSVEGELWDIWSFIAKDNPEAATRVVESAIEAFNILAANPKLGRSRNFGGRLKQLRSWTLTDFPNYVIFYRPISDGIEVFHVLHGARDLDGFWENE